MPLSYAAPALELTEPSCPWRQERRRLSCASHQDRAQPKAGPPPQGPMRRAVLQKKSPHVQPEPRHVCLPCGMTRGQSAFVPLPSLGWACTGTMPVFMRRGVCQQPHVTWCLGRCGEQGLAQIPPVCSAPCCPCVPAAGGWTTRSDECTASAPHRGHCEVRSPCHLPRVLILCPAVSCGEAAHLSLISSPGRKSLWPQLTDNMERTSSA